MKSCYHIFHVSLGVHSHCFFYTLYFLYFLYLLYSSYFLVLPVFPGFAAAYLSSQLVKDSCQDELRVAFDLDAVLFSAESEVHYKTGGLSAFFKHEKANANKLVDEVG